MGETKEAIYGDIVEPQLKTRRFFVLIIPKARPKHRLTAMKWNYQLCPVVIVLANPLGGSGFAKQQYIREITHNQ
ncbi:hypothetical protein BIY37_08360 [Candidatus Brocadia sapporoensis]|uniref:Uncharacterized protein n=2 Tax=Candidatus Brocadia sapporoensis TaxID=392547 RepID=A0A1V6LZ53_9BACT|nr:hypothetical protein BIY37_08360 [Candidatus Brocadia sapporoensis]